MSASNAMENSILLLLFNNTAFANIGDAAGLQPSATAGSLYVSLHTADPGEAGNQSSNECDYTGYSRVAVARTAGGWTVAGNQVSNTAKITFGQMTGGSEDVATHFGIGTGSTGAGVLLFSGEISQPVGGLHINLNITPEIAVGDLVVSND